MVDETPTPKDPTDGEQPETLPLPKHVIERVETLTRRARTTVDEHEREAYRRERDTVLNNHEYEARVREGDTGETLVLYPTEWIDGGTVRIERIADTSRAVERPISGPGADADWETIDSHNRAVAAQVRTAHDEVHGATAAAFADFMSNHYAKPIEAATAGEREEFRTEYFPRNAWPSDEQRRQVDESVQLTIDAANDI